MTPKDLEETLAAMRAMRKQCAGNPQAAREFLVEAGILGEDGRLVPPYADEEEDERAVSVSRRTRARARRRSG